MRQANTYRDITSVRWSFAVSLSAVLVVAILLAVSARINDPLNLDEPFTANRVNHTMSEMLALMANNVQLPLYYVLLRPWRLLFGESELVLRIPSVLYFCGAITFSGLSARRLYGNLPGILAAALVAFSSLGLRYAATARPYMLLGLLVAVYCWAGLLWIQSSRDAQDLIKPNDVVYIVLLGVVGMLGLLSHTVFVFTLAAFTFSALLLSWQHAFRFALASLFAGLLFLILWGPYFYRSILLQSLSTFYFAPGFSETIDGFLKIFGQKKSLVIVAGLSVLVVLQPQGIREFLKERMNLFLGSVLFLSIALPVVVSQIVPVFVATRTPVIALPVASVLIAGLLSIFKRQWIPMGLSLLLAGASFYFSLSNLLNPQRNTFDSQVAQVVDNSECKDVVLSVGITYGEVSYYLRRLQDRECLVHRSFPTVVSENAWTLDYSTLETTEQRSVLMEEAEHFVKEVVDDGVGQVWVFAPTRDQSAVFTEILRHEADSNLILVQEEPGRGTFNDVLLQYRLKE